MNVWIAEVLRVWRGSLRRPAFLLLATGVLALGVGASVAAFILMDGLLLRPLPYPQPQRLVNLAPETGWYVSPVQYHQLQSLQHLTSTGLLKAADEGVNVSAGDVPQLLPAVRMDRGLLATIGVPAPLGRNFTADEDRPGGPPAVMLSHAFWQSRYRGDPQVIGQVLRVDGISRRIVGVLPSSFKWISRASIALPLALPPNGTSEDALYTFIARWDGGASKKAIAAQASARWLAGGTAGRSEPVAASHAHFVIRDLKPVLLGKALVTLGVMQASALLVLLIAMVNLTNLFVLRALAQGKQVAVRVALGASAMRQVLPSLAEGLLVGLCGAVLGMLLAQAGLRWFLDVAQPEWVDAHDLVVGAKAWGSAVLIGLFSAFLAAMLSWWRGRRTQLLATLREGGRAGIGLHGGRFGRLLVAAQVALATVLVSAAVMFAHAAMQEAGTPLGFATSDVVTFELKPVDAIYNDAAATQMLTDRVTARLQAMPGVRDVTVATSLPAMTRVSQGILQPDGRSFMVQLCGVDAGYFRLFHIPLREGRLFTDSDIRGGERVAIINEQFARTAFHGRALGQLLGSGEDRAVIVGVVGDTRAFGVTGSRMVYEPLAQVVGSEAWTGMAASTPLGFAIRSHGPLRHAAATLQGAVAELAPVEAVAHVRTMDQVIRDRTATERLAFWLVGLFTALALLLAAVGVYAVMAVWTASCGQELAVRAAMGASPRRLVGFVFARGLRQVAIGLLAGLGVSLFVYAGLRSTFVEMGQAAWDPMALIVTVAILMAAGVAACLMPSARVAHLELQRVLSAE